MIFVTVGTHEQQFNRLIKYIDVMKKEKIINEEVIMQTGFSTYEPQNCSWNKLYPYEIMNNYVRKARIIITHGGPSSFIMPLQIGKVPIVVPRQFKYEEHVNNHQLDFCKTVAERNGNIIVIEQIEKIKNIIVNYDFIVSSMPNKLKSNNIKFIKEFEKIVERLVK